jgi:hypothetical protein
MAIFKRFVKCHYSYRMMSPQLTRLARLFIVIEKRVMDDQNEEMYFATRLKRSMAPGLACLSALSQFNTFVATPSTMFIL